MSELESAISTRLEQFPKGKILAIGGVAEWENQGHALPGGGEISFLAFHDVTLGALEFHKPAAIYSPVLARHFDCIELAVLLDELNFKGTYRAVGTGLPRPELIEREVRQLLKTLKFEIVQI